VPANDSISNDSAISNNGLLVDQRHTYHLLLKDVLIDPISDNIKEFSSNKVSYELINLALQSGHMSRFKTDPNFTLEQYEKLYKTWIEKSVTGELADNVIVYLVNNIVVGFITVKLKEPSCQISLVGVDKEYRGRNIGSELINYVKYYGEMKGCVEIFVETQSINTAAIKLYSKCGFRLSSLDRIYHFWL
jgi:dTDP-4-amino-4,6-dideoxy-D-galactose acyltransferase